MLFLTVSKYAFSFSTVRQACKCPVAKAVRPIHIQYLSCPFACHLNFLCWVFWNVPFFFLSLPFPSASNPCEENDGRGPCSHLCLINYNRTASCTCPHLMKLSPNKQSCFGEWEHHCHLSCFRRRFFRVKKKDTMQTTEECVLLYIWISFDWHHVIITLSHGSDRKGTLSWMIDFLIISPALKRFLLYVRRSEIRGVDIDNPYLNVMTALTVPDIDDVTVVDYDAQEERIYWADIKTQTIKRAFINGTQLETIISAGGCSPDILTRYKSKLCVWYVLKCMCVPTYQY